VFLFASLEKLFILFGSFSLGTSYRETWKIIGGFYSFYFNQKFVIILNWTAIHIPNGNLELRMLSPCVMS
jgi:hypothetical protein